MLELQVWRILFQDVDIKNDVVNLSLAFEDLVKPKDFWSFVSQDIKHQFPFFSSRVCVYSVCMCVCNRSAYRQKYKNAMIHVQWKLTDVLKEY